MRHVTPTYPSALPPKLARLSKIGLWISGIALLLALLVFSTFLYLTLTSDPEFIADLIHEFEIGDYVSTLTRAQTAVAALIWMSVDILGLLMLWQIVRLFRGFLTSGVFTETTARRLRRIGLIVLAMGPVSILSGTIGGALISAWAGTGGVHGAITIDDSDLYALVIGLVITAVSHIMLEALRLSEENQSFV